PGRAAHCPSRKRISRLSSFDDNTPNRPISVRAPPSRLPTSLRDLHAPAHPLLILGVFTSHRVALAVFPASNGHLPSPRLLDTEPPRFTSVSAAITPALVTKYGDRAEDHARAIVPAVRLQPPAGKFKAD
ncbi:hypothetical protein EVG20_g11216, partial [Dentipellis fragilis]